MYKLFSDPRNSPGRGRSVWNCTVSRKGMLNLDLTKRWSEPRHGKTDKMTFAPSEDSDQPDHPPSWAESLLFAWRKLGSLATQWMHSKDSDQTAQMRRLIWIFAGCTCYFVGFVMLWFIWPTLVGIAILNSYPLEGIFYLLRATVKNSYIIVLI